MSFNIFAKRPKLKKTFLHTSYIILLTSYIILASCNRIDLFERTVSIPGHSWNNSFRPTFNFKIEDTTHAYKAYIIVRHTDAYKYQNIYMTLQVKYPGIDSIISDKINLQLADNSHGWYGSGMDDIWEFRYPLNKKPIHLRKGDYVFTLEQIMRDNPLPYIMNVGIRVERAD